MRASTTTGGPAAPAGGPAAPTLAPGVLPLDHPAPPAASGGRNRGDDDGLGGSPGRRAAPVETVVVEIPLGRRVMVVGDLLLRPEATPSSRALAADVALTLDRWEGPGLVIVCGNLFAVPCGGDGLDAPQVRTALTAHPSLATAIEEFTGRPDCRLLVLPGWRDPEVTTDPEVAGLLCAMGVEVAAAVSLVLETAAGPRRVLVRPGTPVGSVGDLADTAAADTRPWLAGIDRLEDPVSAGRFVTSRTLYRQMGRFVWLPPLLVVVLALLVRLAFVYHGVYHLVRRASGPRHTLVRVYSASWTNRLFVTLGIIVVLELVVAAAVAVASRRFWRSEGGGDLPGIWEGHDAAAAGAHPAGGLLVGGVEAMDEARALVAEGTTGLVTGGGLRAELSHLGPGFFACPGGTTELVREHRGRLGLPPVFLHHRQASWIELETGAELHVRLLLADVDLPLSTTLERVATGYRVVKGYKPAADLHPALVASWPTGGTWPPAPDVAADRVRVRRVRRIAGFAIFVTGLVDLLLALRPPLHGHLHDVTQVLPLGVVQAAGALVALAGIGLMMLARGVLRGQRRSWLVAVALLTATLVLHLAHGASFAGLAVTAVVLVFLVVQQRRFGATTDQGSLRSALVTLVAGGVVAVVVATIVIEVTGRVHHHPIPSWPLVLAASGERLVGLSTIGLPDSTDDWVSPSLLAVGVALVLVALYLLTRPVVDRRLSSGRAVPARYAAEIRARDIVRRHGTGTLDYFALRDDKQWFFHRDSLVAYAVYGGVCLVSPDPIGPVTERGHVWDAFRRYCDRNGWGVAVMAAAEEWLPIYRDSGMRHLYIGDEAVVDVPRFSLSGGKMKGLRQAVNRVERNGYTVRFLDPSRLSPDEGSPLVDLMGRNRRGEHERGFSMVLGRVFDPRDTGLLLTVVDGPDGEPAAMCQFVPSQAINGYSLDLMRRDPGEHPNGLVDFALCSTIDHLREQGARGLSLNFAAMRSTLEGETGDGLTQRVERWALRRMSGVLQIESLWRFNAKYEPSWLPRYIVYDSAEQFAPTVVTILRAESLSEVPVIGRFLTPSATRRSALVQARTGAATTRTPVTSGPGGHDPTGDGPPQPSGEGSGHS
ncbi:MAG: bifunctional lysylphosphatidylglycerol flippase/synthetase MprF [Acidimicrobiales bacterium]